MIARFYSQETGWCEIEEFRQPDVARDTLGLLAHNGGLLVVRSKLPATLIFQIPDGAEVKVIGGRIEVDLEGYWAAQEKEKK